MSEDTEADPEAEATLLEGEDVIEPTRLSKECCEDAGVEALCALPDTGVLDDPVSSKLLKSSLVAAVNFEEGAMDDKPNPSVEAVVTADDADFDNPNEIFSEDEHEEGTSGEAAAALVSANSADVIGFTSGTVLADPNEKPEAGAVEDSVEERPNPKVGTAVVTATAAAVIVVVLVVVEEALLVPDDIDRLNPSPGLLEPPGVESDTPPAPNARPPEAEEDPNPKPETALDVAGFAEIEESPKPVVEVAAGSEAVEDSAPKDEETAAMPFLCLSTVAAGDICLHTASGLEICFPCDCEGGNSGGGSVCLSFSRSLRLVTLFSCPPDSLLTGLITLRGLLSRAALMALSVTGLTPFTGEVRTRFLRVLGVLMSDTLAGDTGAFETDLLGDILDLSRRDSASLSSSVSAADLVGLPAPLLKVSGKVARSFRILISSSSIFPWCLSRTRWLVIVARLSSSITLFFSPLTFLFSLAMCSSHIPSSSLPASSICCSQ